MLDPFLILTPVLLLAIVALLGFVGCYQDVTLTAPVLTHVQTVVTFGPAGTKSLTADPLALQGGELIVVAVQWSSANTTPSMPDLSEASLGNVSFPAVGGGGPFAWYAIDSNHNMMVQIFSASNPAGNTQFTVKTSLLQQSTVPWSLCVSAYCGRGRERTAVQPAGQH